MAIEDVEEIEYLEREIRLLFGGDDFEQLKKWYDYIINSQVSYVVFIVRRSYLLALIMEKITGKKLEASGEALILTDASFFFHCKEMSEYYKKNGKFQDILIADDVLLHGRNINHLIDNMELELYKFLSEYDFKKVQKDFANQVQIHVLARKSGSLLLAPRYEWKLSQEYVEEPKFLHKLSSNISVMILRAEEANASYIFSESITSEEVQKIDEKRFITTSYQNVEEKAYIRYVGDGSSKKAIFTIRLVKNMNGNRYRVIPFVFLPNLAHEQTMIICKEIIEKINIPKCKKWILQMEKAKGKRSFNELLSLILSNVLLQEFHKEYHIEACSVDREKELVKLARNYNEFGLQETKELLEQILEKKLFTIAELEDMLKKNIPDDFAVIQLLPGEKKKVNQYRIKERIEEYFYNRGHGDEKKAYEMLKVLNLGEEERIERSVRGCCFTLKELNEGYVQNEADYSVAYFLQMMDAGVLSISSYASNKINVVGFAQFVKPGEQSLLLYPLEVYEFIPMLTRMQHECEQRAKNLSEEAEKYFRSINKSKEVEKILCFLKKLEETGEQPDDWNENYLFLLEQEKVNEEEKWKFKKRQQEHKDDYLKYLQKKL